MNNDTVLAIDLAKNTLQINKVKASGKSSYNRAVTRKQLQAILVKEKPSLVAMEACGGAHYWARLAQTHGHTVKLMDARAVKAFRPGQKTDKNDASAIAIAARQESVHTVRVLSKEEQGLQSLDTARKLASGQCVAQSNQIRGLLSEFGIVLAQGDAALNRDIPVILEDAENDLATSVRQLIDSLWSMYTRLSEHSQSLMKQVEQWAKRIPQCSKLLALEGVGPTCALKLWIKLGHCEAFKHGKNAAACFGLTPKQHSSGGKEVIGHISRFSADQSLRSALYLGAQAVINQLGKRNPKTTKERWLKALVDRRGVKIAAIALANKTVRTAYALIKHDRVYQTQAIEC